MLVEEMVRSVGRNRGEDSTDPFLYSYSYLGFPPRSGFGVAKAERTTRSGWVSGCGGPSRGSYFLVSERADLAVSRLRLALRCGF